MIPPNRSTARLLRPGEFLGCPDLRVVTKNGVVSLIRQQAHIEQHEHSDTHFVLITAGNYRTSARGAQGVVGPGSVLLNPPGTRHDDQFVGRGRLIVYSLSAELTRHLHRFSKNLCVATVVQGPLPRRMLLRIGREAEELDEISDLEIEGLTYEIIAALSRPIDGGRSVPAWLKRVRAMIQEESEDSPSVAALAREAGVHPVHLTRTFRRFVGLSPGACVRRARAKRAAVMLACSREPICQIALQCGYADQAAFAKSFKRATAISPAEFRGRWSRRG